MEAAGTAVNAAVKEAKKAVKGAMKSPEVKEAVAAARKAVADVKKQPVVKKAVAKAKQICSKVIGPCFWNVSDIRDHWDALELTCSVRPVAQQGKKQDSRDGCRQDGDENPEKHDRSNTGTQRRFQFPREQ